MNKKIIQITKSLSGELSVPGSKSISNRALLLASLAKGSTEIFNLLYSEDTAVMLEALKTLGVQIQKTSSNNIAVRGMNGILTNGNKGDRYELNLGLAGTALRPLTAALALSKGSFLIDGNARMRERPIAPLVNGLQALGAQIKFLDNTGYPPLQVTGTGLYGGKIKIPGNISSQFLTSILMIAPLTEIGVEIEIEGKQVSKPYLDITLALMKTFGAKVENQNYKYFYVPPSTYISPGTLEIEGDASSASYFLAAGAISGSGVTVRGIGKNSIQGDIGFVEILEAMGAETEVLEDCIRVRPGSLKAIDKDLNHIPDAAMTVAILALFAHGTTTIRNIENWKVKETDRLDAMSTELRKVGASVEEGRDFIRVTPPKKLQSAEIETYGDHRMAMCFSLAALGGIPITINNPECVAKTFPNFFKEFERLTDR